VNLPSKWKPTLIRLSEASILIVALLAAWVLWLWFADDGGFEAVYVAIGVLLAGLVAARSWLKQDQTAAGSQTAVSTQTANWRQTAPTTELTTLRRQIEAHFNLDELLILAFDLGLNYENLAGETLTRKIHALIELCQRHGRLPDLISHLRQNRPQVEWAAPAAQPLTSQAQRLRERLLSHVQTTWIEGVLQQSIHSEIIKLSMSYRPEATGQRSWQLVLKQKGQSDQPVSPERSLLDIFNRSGRNLLILGEPGSGKTTTMLQLAEALIKAAQENPAEHIPLVLNLSAWARDQLALTDWLVEEVFVQYGLARELTRSGIAQDQFLYLLDGLDEILDGQARDACIVAINEFKATHPADMVICSRTAEYEALANQLVMGTAVQIQPLNDEQIDAYLSHDGLELQAVRATLTHDEALRELAQTPLMLGLMTLAYRGLSREELKPLANKEARRRHLFDHYVGQMFARRPLPPQTTYSQTQATGWLANLAQGMVTHGHSIFYIERLQPTWLAGDRRRWHQWITGLIVGLIFVLIVGLIYGLIGGLIVGLIFALIVGLSGGEEKRIELAEKVVWHNPSRQALWSIIKPVLIFGLIVGLIFALIFGPIFGLIVGLIFVLIGGLISGLLEFSRSQQITRRIKQPNQGVRQSAWNSLRMGLIFGIGGLIFGLIDGLIFGLFSGLIFGLIFGLIKYGGLAVIQHYSLRWLLARAGVLPFPFRDRRLIAFLDAMHERILLRRVGGGWIFIHRSLLEYFADLSAENE
jgi:DNA polymerase III delta prime subunit